MKYLNDSFSVFPGGNKNYRDNYDKVFGKAEPAPVKDMGVSSDDSCSIQEKIVSPIHDDNKDDKKNSKKKKKNK